jgi:hypothetical protein
VFVVVVNSARILRFGNQKTPAPAVSNHAVVEWKPAEG